MNKAQIFALALYELLKLPLAFVLVPIAVLFARWDNEATTFTGGAPDNGLATVRGDLPGWLAWVGSFDERLPGGMYEPQVIWVYQRLGRYVCSVYWLWRNRMMGLTKAILGTPVVTRTKPAVVYTKRKVGPLMVGWGYKVFRATPQAHWQHGPFVIIPSFTIRLWRSQ